MAASQVGTELGKHQFTFMVLCRHVVIMAILRAAGEARPGMSEALESWRAKEPYGLLSSSSHIVQSMRA
jgi:hypothetical protein